jgi:alkylation response protein AidB-like acyl-CoA dehydrogenase
MQLVEELVQAAVAGHAYADPRLRQRIGQGWMEVQLFRLHSLRTLSRLAAGGAPGPEGSASKLWWSEASKRLHATGMAVLGDESPQWGPWQRSWLYYQASSIWAGTNEIQRNVIGERTLGLPREPR